MEETKSKNERVEIMIVHTNCRYFRGNLPCKPHKKEKIHCEDCSYYDAIHERILIIKLGAIGDVIRTTPLLHALKHDFPRAQITWLTYSPEILPEEKIDNILAVNTENIQWLKKNRFHWLINLDKDPIAITLAASIEARKRSGFIMDEWGRCKAVQSQAAQRKWLTGLWDDVNRKNNRHYVEEIFDICGFTFRGEEYILDVPIKEEIIWSFDETKKVIGLNTGCGGRWTSRLWPEKYWISLAKKCIKAGYEVVLLGGSQEHKKNKNIKKKSGANYPGHFSLKTFINLVNQMDVVVSTVSMAMHLAIGLKKQLVLFNNIFNPNEFYLYNRGTILAPEMDCDCYFSPVCPNNCMETLKVDTVFQAVNLLVEQQWHVGHTV